MEENLPKGWKNPRFTDILDIMGGTQPPKSHFVFEKKDGYVRLLQIRDFGKKPFPTFIPDKKSLRKCKSDDILIARYGASIGRILTGKDGAYNVAIAKVDIPDSIEKVYVYYYLKSFIFQSVITSFQRTAQSGFNKKDLSFLNFLLPPLPEQKRIVAKLDTLFASLDNTKARLEKIPQLLKNFRQAVLTQAVTGKLTEEWREGKELGDVNEIINIFKALRLKNTNSASQKRKVFEIYENNEEGTHFFIPQMWSFVSLDKLVDGFSYGSSAKSLEIGQIPVLRMGNIQNGKIDWSDLKYSSNPKEIEKYQLEKGDLLFNRTNSPELVGKAAIYKGEQPAIYAGYLIKIPKSDVINPFYLNYVLNTDYAKKWCWSVKSDGVSQSNINAQKLSKFEVPFCSLEEQHEIVRRVESLFAKADAIEQQYQKLKEKVDALPQAILAKAFRGELVEQNPLDEPASVLLERIRAEKEKVAVKGKKKTMKRKVDVAAEPDDKYRKKEH